MKLFQNCGISPAYLPRLDRLTVGLPTFLESKAAFLADRFGACHLLKPVLDCCPDAFFTNGDDISLQRKWATEQGLPLSVSLESILLAQIEHHRAEVFYNSDPMRYGSNFVRRLPACVKRTIAWRAAPSPGADFSAYDLVVCNFASILRSYEARGWRASYFSPAHDPVMNEFARNKARPIDILFVGGYSRHHRRRAEVLERVAARRDDLNIRFHLDRSRITRLSESSLGRFLPLGTHRRPTDIVAVSSDPVFGLDLYRALSTAKIVLNGAVDMAGNDRGNMRCFEALGCGALMVSDSGLYPPGMEDGRTMLSYTGVEHVSQLIYDILARPDELVEIAERGHAMIASTYSKTEQWISFQRILAAL